MAQDVWTIEMLGWLRATRGTIVERSLSQKAARLLAYLAFYNRTAHPREELAALLWPEATEKASRHNLRTTLYEIRRLLEPSEVEPGSVLAADRDSVRLVPDAFTTDVAVFTAAAAAVVADDAAPIDALKRALAWYRGEFLAGFFDTWILSERRRLATLHAEVLARLLDALAAAGRRVEAVDVAHNLIARDPLDDAAHLSLMRLYAAEGRISAALDQYRAFAAVLRDELGVEPSPEARTFELELRRRAEAEAPTSSKPVDAPLPKPPGIPTHLTEFVGRESEIDHLRALLLDGPARLATIVGPGGIGKTRLATEVARLAESQSDARVVFVELADIVDQTFVVSAIAAGTGLGGPPAGRLLDAVAEAFADVAHPLLVVDNAEQVVERIASIVLDLLAQVTGLKVLATSRVPLGVQGEVEVRLGPLPTPAGWERPEDLGHNPSVALYVDRARAKRPDFQLTEANAAAVARLCTRLEGIPLALELAAGRERVLPAAQMIVRLEKRFDVLASAQRDVPERHRTLSAAIDWSVRALDPEAQRAFARLSVFRGGWALEEAEAICASPDAVDAVERMCEVSLVEAFDRAGVRRFRMLETIREFAAGQVAADERDELHRMHTQLFLALAERAQVYLSGPEQAAWLERIDAEFENIRAALDRSLRAVDAVTVVRIFIALARYWPARARRREARYWFREAVARGGDRLPHRLRGRGLRYAAELAFAESDLDESRRYLEESLAESLDDDDPQAIASTLSGLGHIAARHDEFDTARDMFSRGAEVAATSGDLTLRATLANDLGILEARTGNYERALDRFSESLAIYRELGDETSTIILLFNLGYLATIVGRFDDAEAFLDESLATSRRIGHGIGLASASTFRGLLELRRERGAEAIRQCIEAIDLCLDVGERHRLVLAVEGLGLALAMEGRDDLALRALGHAEALRLATETEALLEDPSLSRRCIATLAARVGESEVARLLARGRAASTEQLRAAVARAVPPTAR